jgi:hypothetical protein
MNYQGNSRKITLRTIGNKIESICLVPSTMNFKHIHTLGIWDENFISDSEKLQKLLGVKTA